MQNIMESWKVIAGFENYEVSDLGNVRNIKTGRILKPNSDKYLIVNLTNNKKAISKAIHKLVANAFLENPLNKKCVDHIDHNTKNNKITNLRWCSQQQNLQNKSKPKTNTSGFKGVRKFKTKFQACIGLNGKVIHLGYFNTAEEAGRAYDQKALELFGGFASVNVYYDVN